MKLLGKILYTTEIVSQNPRKAEVGTDLWMSPGQGRLLHQRQQSHLPRILSRLLFTIPSPVAGQHRKEPASIFFAASLGASLYVDHSPSKPFLFTRLLNRPSSLSLSLEEGCSSIFIIFQDLGCTLSTLCIPLLQWATQSRTQCSRRGHHPCQAERKHRLPRTCRLLHSSSCSPGQP